MDFLLCDIITISDVTNGFLFLGKQIITNKFLLILDKSWSGQVKTYTCITSNLAESKISSYEDHSQCISLVRKFLFHVE